MPDDIVTRVDFLGNDAPSAGQVEVWTRAHWADPWTAQPDLHCVEATWSCAPSLPTAQFRCAYGRVLQLAASSFADVGKVYAGQQRAYVKVKFTLKPDPNDVVQTRYWYGVLELEVDEMLGAVLDPPTTPVRRIRASGFLHLTAYGLEILLARHRIRTSFFDSAGAAVETAQRVPFNAGGKGNRTRNVVDGSYLFATNLLTAEKWHSQAIVKYLLARQTPRDRLGQIPVPWRLDAVSEPAVATWDLPQLPQEEATSLSLINRLLDRRRLSVWWTSVDESTTPHTAVVYVDTLTRTAIPLEIPGAAPIPANRSLKALSFDEDQLTNATIKDSDVQRYDVVVCRGAPELSVGSFSIADGSLATKWSPGDQYNYEFAASGSAGYSVAGTKEQQKRNARARAAPAVQHVFSRFEIPFDWNLRVGDGEGGAKHDLFPDQVLGGSMAIYLPEIHAEHNLPLVLGVNYANDAIKNGVSEPKDSREEFDLLVFLKAPESGRWVRGDDYGQAGDVEQTSSEENHLLSVSVRALPRTRIFEFRVTGQPQHAIASGDFTPLAVDKRRGSVSFRQMILTCALPNGKRVSGQWPPREPEAIDAVRWMEIDAGEYFRKIYVAPGTVIGVAADGTLLRSTGGYIPKPSGPDDHEAQLKSLAKMAAAWYTVPHRVLTLQSTRLVGDAALQLGEMVTEIGHPTVPGGHQAGLNTPITEIRFDWPLAIDEAVEAPHMLVQTWAGELDPIQTGPVSTVVELGSKLLRRVPINL